MATGLICIDNASGRGRQWPLHGSEASRALESVAASGLAAQALMQRAGLSVARLALALAPHSHRIWIAAGPGNNGGDGLEAALHLHRAGKSVEVSLLAGSAGSPVDALVARQRAQAAGVTIVPGLPGESGLDPTDLVIDALLGLGATHRPGSPIDAAISLINRAAAPRLAVDLPSGLHPDSGAVAPGALAVQASHTMSLLSLKPGLFMGCGRDHAGRVWFDDLGVAPDGVQADAWLAARPVPAPRRHALHKGSFGDVLVVGGAHGMAGAALLAARAALAAGAGRVYLAALDPAAASVDPMFPELMHRPGGWRATPTTLAASTVVCGCGGGDAVREALPSILSHAGRLLLDADALNAIACDTALQRLLAGRADKGAVTLLTPHPLEAARLLGIDAQAVQADRLQAASMLVDRYGCGIVLKGSGTVIAAPGHDPVINPTGNARLASAGTGDVLAGWIGGRWSASLPGDSGKSGIALAMAAAISGVWQHGRAAARDGLCWDLPAIASDLIASLQHKR